MDSRIFGSGTTFDQSTRLCVDERYNISNIAQSVSRASEYCYYCQINYHDAHDELKEAVRACVNKMLDRMNIAEGELR